MKAEKIDVSLMPSRLMQTARQVKISNILNSSLSIVKVLSYTNVITWFTEFMYRTCTIISTLRLLTLTVTPTYGILVATNATSELLLWIVLQLVPTVELKMLIMRRGKLYSKCMKKILLTNELTMSLSNN